MQMHSNGEPYTHVLITMFTVEVTDMDTGETERKPLRVMITPSEAMYYAEVARLLHNGTLSRREAVSAQHLLFRKGFISIDGPRP